MNKSLYANWKMNKTLLEAENFFSTLDRIEGKDVGIAIPFTMLATVSKHAKSLGVSLGAQNMSEYASGAYTGEISATQIADAGGEFVFLGHSERRHLFKETSEVIGRKVERAIVESMPFILCVGETLEERERGVTRKILKEQLSLALGSILETQIKGMKLAYEPVWAIGTGKSATSAMAEETHQMIRDELKALYSEAIAENVPILYGGSVKLDNLEDLLTQPNIDGALVGNASLEATIFNQMIQILEE